MRRQVLGAANAAQQHGGMAKKRSDSNFYKLTIGGFLGVYILLQLFLWLGNDSTDAPGAGKAVIRNAVKYQQAATSSMGNAWNRIMSAGRGSGSVGVVTSEAVEGSALKGDREGSKGGIFFGASGQVGNTLVEATPNDFKVVVTDGGEDFEWSSLDQEPPYPTLPGNEDAVPILAVRPQLEDVGKDWEASVKGLVKAAEEEARAGGKDVAVAAAAVKKPPRGANSHFDAMSVTIGHPCWQSPRLLYAMGLDDMAAYLSDEPPPRDLLRSKAPHAYADLTSSMWCSYHTTPIQGGLQCCCNSNISASAYRTGKTKPPAEIPETGGSFFCLPSMTFSGARGAGVGRLYGLFHQHAYMVTAPSTPPHIHSSVENRLLVDGVMPRYVQHYLKQTPKEFQAMTTFEERNKAVSSKYWVDASPSYFYGIHAPLMLRKLLPRGKVIILLRDTVTRGYNDLVRFLAGRKGMDVEESLLTVVHGCARAFHCSASEKASTTPLAQWGTKGSQAFTECVQSAVSKLPELATVAKSVEGDHGAPSLACLAAAVGPGGEDDWNNAWKSYSLTSGKASTPVTCSAIGGESEPGVAAGTVGTPLYSEARGVIRWGLRQVIRKQVVGCFPGDAWGRSPTVAEDLAKVTQEEVGAAIRRAAPALAACTSAVEPGMDVPVPTDLLAGIIAGFDLNLVEVSAGYPATATFPAKVLTDGTDACFPGGLEGYGPDSEAHALGRSLYLRPLQRLHAAYGKEVPVMYDSSGIKTRPLNIVDPILESLLVYKPVLEPGKTKAAVAKLGWRGEEFDADADAPGVVPEMGEEVQATLLKLYTPYDAALRVYLGKTHKKIYQSWLTTKAAKGEEEGAGGEEEVEEKPMSKGKQNAAKRKGGKKKAAA